MKNKIETAKLYRKKPYVVQAIQWNGINLTDIQNFCGKNIISVEYYDGAWEVGKGPLIAFITIKTPDYTKKVHITDYIVKEGGQFNSYDPYVFKLLFEKF